MKKTWRRKVVVRHGNGIALRIDDETIPVRETKDSKFIRLLKFRDWIFENEPGIRMSALEKKLGLCNGYFNTKVTDTTPLDKMSLEPSTIDKVCAAYPELNRVWLETGAGDMFGAAAGDARSAPVVSDLNNVVSVIREAKRGLPQYGCDFAGCLDGAGAPLAEFHAAFVDFEPYNRLGTLWCNVYDNSMSPALVPGDKACLKDLGGNVGAIEFGRIYGVVTRNGFRTIKRAIRSGDEAKVRLVPDNRDPQYGDYQDVPYDDIVRVYRLVGAMRPY